MTAMPAATAACCFMAALLASCASHGQKPGQEQGCESKASLAGHEGHYARKALWENLPELRDWNSANRFKGMVNAFTIDATGETFAELHWHEGGSVCAKFRGDALWAKESSSPHSRWEGPFLRVSSSSEDTKVVYFNRLFGSQCFVANGGESWCFGPGTISINGQAHQARLVLDTVEFPKYGSSVSVQGPPSIQREGGVWVFVPHGKGWKVFQDTLISEEGHQDIDPTRSQPWRVLVPK
jgi:hypothetical protein